MWKERNDLDEAKKRAQLLIDSISAANGPPNGVTLWLIARYPSFGVWYVSGIVTTCFVKGIVSELISAKTDKR